MQFSLLTSLVIVIAYSDCVRAATCIYVKIFIFIYLFDKKTNRQTAHLMVSGHRRL